MKAYDYEDTKIQTLLGVTFVIKQMPYMGCMLIYVNNEQCSENSNDLEVRSTLLIADSRLTVYKNDLQTNCN